MILLIHRILKKKSWGKTSLITSQGLHMEARVGTDQPLVSQELALIYFRISKAKDQEEKPIPILTSSTILKLGGRWMPLKHTQIKTIWLTNWDNREWLSDTQLIQTPLKQLIVH